MKVFDVLVESLPDGWSLNRENGRWVARDPQGNVRASGRVRGNVEGRARDWIANNTSSRTPVADPEQRSAADRGSSERGRPSGGRQEPPLTRDSSRPSLVADPEQRSAADRGSADGGRNYDLRTDVRPGTPTSDSLSAGERRRLSRTGSITRRGVTYTRAQISAADAEAERLRGSTAGRDVRPGDDRASSASQNRNPSDKKSWIRTLLGKVWNHPAARGLRTLFGSTGFAALQTAFNATQAEDALDGYLRAIKEEANSVGPEGQAAFINNLRSGNFPPRIAQAYAETIERFNQLFFEAVIGVVAAGGWTAYVLLTGFSLGTGFVGAVLALVAGGAVVVGGTTVIYELLERVGINDWFEDRVTAQILSPSFILGLAIETDGYQEVFGVVADEWGRLLSLGAVDNAGDLIRDSIMHEEGGNGVVSPREAKDIVADMIKSNPELLAAYNRGKEEAKEIMRSGEPESN